uniref:Calmodulin n=1 Tax=Trepomonas sp. PC1 TaxID=1076344 RepID=A0A146K5U1_9EUKA|eukprot:JAP92242.1 Calmodulin [Trepomonas sp. PC1]
MGGSCSTNKTQVSDRELQYIFQKFDENGDQTVDHDELEKFMSSIGFDLPKDVIKAMMILADDNGDGILQKKEFKKFVPIILDTESLAEIIYKVADEDGNGIIDVKEFTKLRSKMGWEAIKLPETQLSKMEFIELINPMLAQFEGQIQQDQGKKDQFKTEMKSNVVK